MDDEKGGMQGIFGVLLVVGGIVLVMVVLADLGGFFGNIGNLTFPNGAKLFGPTIQETNIPAGTETGPSIPGISIGPGTIGITKGSNAQVLCESGGGAWINGVCYPGTGATT